MAPEKVNTMNKAFAVVAGITATIALLGWMYSASGKVTVAANNANEVPALKEDFRNFKEEVHINNKSQQDAMINLSSKMDEVIEVVKEYKRENQWDKFNSRKSK